MCGRFTHMMTWSQVHALYSIHNDQPGKNTAARYNIAPTQQIYIVRWVDGRLGLVEARWGLLAPWAKEVKGQFTVINATREKLLDSSMFKQAFAHGRCLVPSDGYYEWTSAEDKGKDPWYIHLENRQPFSFAGIYSYNSTLGILSCTIITAPSVAPTTAVHERMPIILDPSVYEEWMDPATTPTRAMELLDHNLGGDLRMYRVSRQVNSFKFEGDASAVEPIEV